MFLLFNIFLAVYVPTFMFCIFWGDQIIPARVLSVWYDAAWTQYCWASKKSSCRRDLSLSSLDPRLLPETDWLWSQGERSTAGEEFCDLRISASSPLAKIENMIMFHVISMLSCF